MADEEVIHLLSLLYRLIAISLPFPLVKVPRLSLSTLVCQYWPTLRLRQGAAAYSSSKAAIIALTKELASELAPNIWVNAINPVLVHTPMLSELAPEGVDIEKLKEMMIESVPLKRIATPEDVAQAALYLASDDFVMLTGTCINFDGGRGI
jgi:3-oxoacyl-[acyl-carrier protein] reductase